MARLTRAQRREVETAIGELRRGMGFIANPRIAVGHLGRAPATTTLHFTRADGATFYAINKEIGSDLCGFDFAIRALRRLLAEQPVQSESV